MSKYVLCIDTNELIYDAGEKLSLVQSRQMTLEEWEIHLGRPLDHEDFQYVNATECEGCNQKSCCGEYNRQKI